MVTHVRKCEDKFKPKAPTINGILDEDLKGTKAQTLQGFLIITKIRKRWNLKDTAKIWCQLSSS